MSPHSKCDISAAACAVLSTQLHAAGNPLRSTEATAAETGGTPQLTPLPCEGRGGQSKRVQVSRRQRSGSPRLFAGGEGEGEELGSRERMSNI